MQFNGICCSTVVFVPWHQRAEEIYTGLEGAGFACLFMPFGFFFFLTPKLATIKAFFFSPSDQEAKAHGHICWPVMRKLCLHASLFL